MSPKHHSAEREGSPFDGNLPVIPEKGDPSAALRTDRGLSAR